MLKVGSMIETDENGLFYRPVKISRTLDFLLNFEILESDEKIYLEGADGENFTGSVALSIQGTEQRLRWPTSSFEAALKEHGYSM